MAAFYTEADYENSVIELFQNMGYRHVYAPDLERDFKSPLYEEELDEALHRLNPTMPEDAIADALYKLKNFENAELVQKNALFMDYLQHGVEVRYFVKGEERSGLVYLVDYKNPDNNSFVVANQWTFIENSNKRPDVLLFLNGMPVVLIELKSPSREETDASEAYTQIRNYMHEIPSMFIYNCICVMSDLMTSKAGTITSGEDRFMEWKTKDGSYENTQYAQFDTFFEGIFEKQRFLDIIKNFICFSNEGTKQFKILAGYHQYFAVNKAIASTKHATQTDGKGGVFWHTQGSGKSLSMVFYAHRLQDALDSPTIVVITDRNDLDDQLYGQFAKCKNFLRQEPVHAQSRAHLKELLNGRKANGIIFTTMQKFEESFDCLSERRNIVVMADEAHRGQYGLKEKVDAKTGELKIGAARVIRNALPNATYIGFTGTPISMKDRNTREVFGDYIDIYDMTQAVEDGATRPVYYESRVIKLKLDEKTLKLIDQEYDIMANNADPEVIEKSKQELGQMEAILGNDKTINSLVEDILNHYENYRENLLTGKAMIVAYSRPIAMKIYERILQLRPGWKEKVAVVMTSSNKDPEEWNKIIGNKHHKDELAKEFKDNDSPLKIAIVVDMWLTGFDVPSLATMYVYKPMQGYNLMQAIARVNRVFGDKEGGLVVDYVGIASALKQAMNDYTARDKKNYGDTDVAKVAYPRFLEKLSICRDLFHGYDYSKFITGTNLERSKAISGAVNFIVGVDKEREREDFLKEALLLKQALSLCSSLAEKDMRIEAAFFESVRVLVTRLMNQGEGKKISLPEMNARVNELLKASVGSQDGCTLRCGNIRAAMPGIAESVRFPEVAGYISVSRQRPAQRAIGNSNPAAQGKQAGAHFLGKQLVQNVPLVLRKAVQICQRVHRFAADRNVQNVLRDRLRVGVVLGGFGSGVYFFDLVGDLVHSPKGVLDALHLGGIDNDNVAIRVEVGMYCKDGQHLRPVACPCMTVLVVVGDGGFAALRVGGYDVIDGRAEVGVGVGYDFGNRDAVGIAGFIGKQDAHR